MFLETREHIETAEVYSLVQTVNTESITMVGTISNYLVGEKVSKMFEGVMKPTRKLLDTATIWEDLVLECVNQHGDSCTMIEVR